MNILDFLFRLNDINLKQKEIKRQEQAANQVQGLQQMFYETLISSSKQTLEVIMLTRTLNWLTLLLVIIGIVQIVVILLK